ncbi:hypothetical protein [Bdellovibrio sp. GT3]|uniref:hypothetical protein n=1 Tax=Bdellovibrio sp. GT3 TaxID=3136282 RepID=UPI0030F16F8A
MKKAIRKRIIHFWEAPEVPLLGAVGGPLTGSLTMRQLLVAVLLTMACFSSNAQAAAPLCSEVFTPSRASIPLITKRVAENIFATNRNLEDYSLELHPDFKVSIAKLTANQHWVDLGAGKATAQIQFLKSFKNKSDRPQMTAVAFKLDRWFKPSTFNGKLSIQEGAYEAMPTASWKKADVVTDLYGVLSYTTDFSGALQKTVDMMNVHGELYLLALPWGYQFEKGPTQMDLPQYLEGIEGLRIEHLQRGQFKITKTQESVTIPPVELLRYTDSPPPLRTFQIK